MTLVHKGRERECETIMKRRRLVEQSIPSVCKQSKTTDRYLIYRLALPSEVESLFELSPKVDANDDVETLLRTTKRFIGASRSFPSTHLEIQKLAEFALREDNGSEPLKRKKVQKSPLFSPAGSDPFGEFPPFRAPFPGLQRLELRPSLLAPIRRADMHQNAPLRQLHRPPGRLDQPKHVRFPRFSHPGSS